MELQVLPDPDAVAKRAAQFIAEEACNAMAVRGRFTLAVSGGRTPWQMLRFLADEDLPWANVHLFQVDERIAPPGDPDRNLTHMRESLLARVALPPANLHAMQVEATDTGAAAARYALEIASIAGTPAVLDFVHLGLGPDGHTASLIPGDPALSESYADVALTQPYQGHRRMTLTYPILNRSRCVFFVVTGAEKFPMLARLRSLDPTIPAGRITGQRALIMADAAAAGNAHT